MTDQPAAVAPQITAPLAQTPLTPPAGWPPPNLDAYEGLWAWLTGKSRGRALAEAGRAAVREALDQQLRSRTAVGTWSGDALEREVVSLAAAAVSRSLNIAEPIPTHPADAMPLLFHDVDHLKPTPDQLSSWELFWHAFDARFGVSPDLLHLDYVWEWTLGHYAQRTAELLREHGRG